MRQARTWESARLPGPDPSLAQGLCGNRAWGGRGGWWWWRGSGNHQRCREGRGRQKAGGGVWGAEGRLCPQPRATVAQDPMRSLGHSRAQGYKGLQKPPPLGVSTSPPPPKHTPVMPLKGHPELKGILRARPDEEHSLHQLPLTRTPSLVLPD